MVNEREDTHACTKSTRRRHHRATAGTLPRHTTVGLPGPEFSRVFAANATIPDPEPGPKLTPSETASRPRSHVSILPWLPDTLSGTLSFRKSPHGPGQNLAAQLPCPEEGGPAGCAGGLPECVLRFCPALGRETRKQPGDAKSSSGDK